MRRTVGSVLIAVGMLMMAFGAIGAVREIGQTYERLSNDPLGEPDIPEEARPGRMLRHAALGGAGLVPLLAGIVIGRRRVRIRLR